MAIDKVQPQENPEELIKTDHLCLKQAWGEARRGLSEGEMGLVTRGSRALRSSQSWTRWCRLRMPMAASSLKLTSITLTLHDKSWMSNYRSSSTSRCFRKFRQLSSLLPTRLPLKPETQHRPRKILSSLRKIWLASMPESWLRKTKFWKTWD